MLLEFANRFYTTTVYAIMQMDDVTEVGYVGAIGRNDIKTIYLKRTDSCLCLEDYIFSVPNLSADSMPKLS